MNPRADQVPPGIGERSHQRDPAPPFQEGRIPESLIDSLCCEVLAVKFRLGLFDDPFRYQAKEREKCYYALEHLDAARRVARSSMVLLENRGGVLPLKKGSRIALVGPFADSRWDLIGSWVISPRPAGPRTFLVRTAGRRFGVRPS